MWINPKNSDEIFEGDDGGIWHSKDKAKTFQQFVSMPLGQYYGISCDMRKPYWVFGGCQDNGGFGTPSATTDPAGIRNNLVIYITGGDGFHTQNDPTDHNIVYSESQNGNVQRIDLSKKGKGKGKGDFDIDEEIADWTARTRKKTSKRRTSRKRTSLRRKTPRRAARAAVVARRWQGRRHPASRATTAGTGPRRCSFRRTIPGHSFAARSSFSCPRTAAPTPRPSAPI